MSEYAYPTTIDGSIVAMISGVPVAKWTTVMSKSVAVVGPIPAAKNRVTPGDIRLNTVSIKEVRTAVETRLSEPCVSPANRLLYRPWDEFAKVAHPPYIRKAHAEKITTRRTRPTARDRLFILTR